MLKRRLSPPGRALFLAAMALVIVLLAFIGLARLAADAPAPAARAAAPVAELVAGDVAFDASAVAAERQRDILGALLTFFLLGGAICAAAFAAWAAVLAVRGPRAAGGVPGEEAFEPLPEPSSNRPQLS